jgi:hypothetical protein
VVSTCGCCGFDVWRRGLFHRSRKILDQQVANLEKCSDCKGKELSNGLITYPSVHRSQRVAARQGRAGYGAFNSSKAGLRAIAQAMAKEYGGDGIHVGHVVVYGAIGGEKIFKRFPEAAGREDTLLSIEGIVDAFALLYRQPQRAWSFEVGVRTSKGKVVTGDSSRPALVRDLEREACGPRISNSTIVEQSRRGRGGAVVTWAMVIFDHCPDRLGREAATRDVPGCVRNTPLRLQPCAQVPPER